MLYIKINGLNHIRYAGVDKESNKILDFDPVNKNHYRPANTIQELEACVNTAINYYSSCVDKVIIEPLSIEFITEL